MLISFIAAALVIVLDQITKYWAQNALQVVGDIPLWEGVFHLHYARNTGAAFSFLSGNNIFFCVVAGAAMLFLLVFIVLRAKKLHPALLLCLGLILGGGIGNLIDRIQYGYVVDFLYFRLINFAIFNVADMALVVGSILLALYIIFFYDRFEKKSREKQIEDADHQG